MGVGDNSSRERTYLTELEPLEGDGWRDRTSKTSVTFLLPTDISPGNPSYLTDEWPDQSQVL